MAQPLGADRPRTLLGHWHREATNIADVTSAMTGFRSRGATVRAAPIVLCVLPHTDAGAATAHEVIDRLGAGRPAQVVVVVRAQDRGRSRLDAEVAVHTVERGDVTLRLVDVSLSLAGAAAGHVDSAVAPFLSAGVPVTVWLPDRLPRPGQPVLEHHASRVIVDTGSAPVARWDGVLDMSRRLAVTDLAWIRLGPWMESVAGLFEGNACRPFLDRVRRVRVAGTDGFRHLLAGWMASRLRLSQAVVETVPEDQRQARIGIVAEHAGREGRFAVTRSAGSHDVRTSVEIAGGATLERRVTMRERPIERLLGRALLRPCTDAVYNDALATAVEWWS